MPDPVVIFLTDYGRDDDFVGICHGVIERGCPGARVIDLSHGIAPQDVLGGALTLHRGLPYLPGGIVLAVVDPGVGGARRPVAVRAADGRLFVGPDNGLLWPAVQAGGGAEAVVDLAGSPLRLAPVSATFHGRDVFAPVAAGLAAGTPLQHVGELVEASSLVALELPRARWEGESLVATVIGVDHFGNVQLAAEGCDFSGEVTVGGTGVETSTARTGRTFDDVGPGELLLYADAQDALALAVNRGSAAARLGVTTGAELRLTSR